MNNCGCGNISYGPFEFAITDENLTNLKRKNFNGIINIPYEDKLCLLKEKSICNFTDILDQLECGILPDLEFLLEEISLIDIEEEKNTIMKFKFNQEQHLIKKKGTDFPYIDKETGNWFIGKLNTGVHATGPTPVISEETGNWVIGEIDTGISAIPIIPHIDEETGNWFIDDEDTGVYSIGSEYSFIVSPNVFRIDSDGNLLDSYGYKINVVNVAVNAYELINNKINSNFEVLLNLIISYENGVQIETSRNLPTSELYHLTTPFVDINGKINLITFQFLKLNIIKKEIVIPFIKDGLNAASLALSIKEIDELLI